MGECISRKAAHELVRSLERFRWRDPETGRGRDTLDYDQVQFGIDKIKECDVQPVRHGRWKLNKQYGDYECSVCGNGDVIAPFFYTLKMKYCPNCGAKMDGESDE